MKLPPALTRRCLELGAKSPSPMSEKTFQGLLVAFAKGQGWLVYHTHDSRRSEKGYPDLTLVRERVVFAELKTDAGRLSVEQERWVEALRLARAECYVWRPADWPVILETLT